MSRWEDFTELRENVWHSPEVPAWRCLLHELKISPSVFVEHLPGASVSADYIVFLNQSGLDCRSQEPLLDR